MKKAWIVLNENLNRATEEAERVGGRTESHS